MGRLVGSCKWKLLVWESKVINCYELVSIFCSFMLLNHLTSHILWLHTMKLSRTF